MKYKELKYCCDSFMIYATGHKSDNPNIRILKLNSPYYFYHGEKKFRQSPFWFVITQGYLDEYKIDMVGNISIQYCPFCGTDLYRYYRNEAYANEIEGVTYMDGYKPE